MRIQIFMASMILASSTRPPLLDPDRFPQIDINILPVGDQFYRIRKYLDLGSSTRVYVAKREVGVSRIPADQRYRPPNTPGILLEGMTLPDEMVIKCLSTNVSRLLSSISNEIEVFRKLNPVQTVRTPRGFYLSPRWRCNDNTNYECRYLAMTLENHDIQRSVSRNELKLRHPVLIGMACPHSAVGDIYSFEVFIASFGLALIAELGRLHEAGFVHGDVRVPNIAVDKSDRGRVCLLDVGASKVLNNYDNVRDRETLKLHDFDQVPRLLLRLVSGRVRRSYGVGVSLKTSRLYHQLDRVSKHGRERLVALLTSILQQQYGETRLEDRIIYKYVP